LYDYKRGTIKRAFWGVCDGFCGLGINEGRARFPFGGGGGWWWTVKAIKAG
jgi:hypothetical protein